MIAEYREERQLGTGRAGRLMLATYDATGAYVAIRHLRPRLWADPEFLARFRAEARILADLEHPHIVRLHEYVETPTSATIVTELVDGIALRELLAAHRTTSPEAALVLARDCLRALAAAHEHGIAHRNLTPENVFVQADGTSKVADFGLPAPAAVPGLPDGTPAYVAPEVLAGAPASPASDLYAVTCLLVECLTGHPPYGEDGRTERTPLDEVPASVRALAAQGLAEDPAARPSTAAAYATAVEEAAAAAHGPAWDKRGRRHLAEAATVLALRFPLADPPPAVGRSTTRTGGRTTGRGPVTSADTTTENRTGTAGTTLRTNVLGGLHRARSRAAGIRRRAGAGSRRSSGDPGPGRPRMAVGAGLLTLGVALTLIVLARGPADQNRETFLVPSPKEPTQEAVAPGEGPPLAAPTKDATRPSANPSAPTGTGKRDAAAPPGSGPGTTATTPPAAARPAVTDLSLAGFDGSRASAAVRASGPVTLTVHFAEGPSADRLVTAAPKTYTVTGSAVQPVTYAFAAPPCGTTVVRQITVTTSPPAPGGPVSRTRKVTGPACPAPAVQAVRITSWNGTTATVGVTAAGPGPVRLNVAFTRRDGGGKTRTVHTETRTLSGRTDYTVDLTHNQGTVTCGGTTHLGIVAETTRASANGPQISEITIDAPPCAETPAAAEGPAQNEPAKEP
jgi:hypothetical protein